MAEDGEIPAKAADDDDETEEGEVVATPVKDDKNEKDDDKLVDATVVADENPPPGDSASKPLSTAAVKDDLKKISSNNKTDDADDDDEEEGEIPETQPPLKKEGGDKVADSVKEAEEKPEPKDKTKTAPSSSLTDSSETAPSSTGGSKPGVSTANSSKVEVKSSSSSPVTDETKTEQDQQKAKAVKDKEAKDGDAKKEEDKEAADKTTTSKKTPPPKAGSKTMASDAESAEEGEVEDGEMEESPAKAAVKEEANKDKNSSVVKESSPAKGNKDAKEKATSMQVDDEAFLPNKDDEKSTSITGSTGTGDSAGKKDNPNEDGEEDGEVKEEAGEEDMKEDTETVDEEDTKDDTEEDGEIKEDVEMDDAMSQSDDGVDRDRDVDTASNDADTASVDGDADSVVDDRDHKKVESSYSTRGRGSGTTTPVPRDALPSAKVSGATAAGSGNDQWARSLREAVENLGRIGKEAPPAGVGPGGSFLDALGEEERRTRTRFLPAVDGIHMLRKNEIKGDLGLARSIMSNAGNLTSVAAVAGTGSGSVSSKKKSKKKQDGPPGEADAMDTDDGNLSTASGDDRSSDGATRVSSAIEVEEGHLLTVPSTAFVPPAAATQVTSTAASNGEKKEDGTYVAPVIFTGVKGILNNQRNIKSPKVVESVTAFNPPRPPESVGKKKQHRMLRWERRPTDVEVDLNNYRKTVDRTRKELHAAEDELERVEQSSNHLRRHFLGHLHCMDQEYDQVLNELNSVQQECVNVADLLTSRTRSRGAGKGSYVMRDVLAVLKQRGAEIKDKGLSLQRDPPSSSDATVNFAGIGGVSAQSFADWNDKTAIEAQPIASAWVLPGDTVETPCGEGVVVKLFDRAPLNVEDPALDGALLGSSSSGKSPSKMDVDSTSKGASTSSLKPKSSPSGTKANPTVKAAVETDNIVGPRICVRLPFGIAYFSPAAVKSKASPIMMSDAQLTKRWKGLIETALAHAGQLDLAGMISPEDFDAAEVNDNADENGDPSDGGAATMDVEDKESSGGALVATVARKVKDPSEAKLLPFASGLLPTATGRGNMLAEMDAIQLQKELKPALVDGSGVLGDVSPFHFLLFSQSSQITCSDFSRCCLHAFCASYLRRLAASK